jgi:Putative zinc-finger
MTAVRLEEVLALFRTYPKKPAGDHLTDQHFAAYLSESLAPDEVERLDNHLQSCEHCSRELERRLEEADDHSALVDKLTEMMLHDEDPDVRQVASEAMAQFPSATRTAAAATGDSGAIGPAVMARDERLGDDQESGGILSMFPEPRGVVLARAIGLAVTAAKTVAAHKMSQGWQTGGTSDDRLKSKYRENDKGGIEVRIASKTLRHGSFILLKAGAWIREVALHRVRPHQVGAEVVISREERSTIPLDADLTTDVNPRRSGDEATGQAE